MLMRRYRPKVSQPNELINQLPLASLHPSLQHIFFWAINFRYHLGLFIDPKPPCTVKNLVPFLGENKFLIIPFCPKHSLMRLSYMWSKDVPSLIFSKINFANIGRTGQTWPKYRVKILESCKISPVMTFNSIKCQMRILKVMRIGENVCMASIRGAHLWVYGTIDF